LNFEALIYHTVHICVQPHAHECKWNGISAQHTARHGQQDPNEWMTTPELKWTSTPELLYWSNRPMTCDIVENIEDLTLRHTWARCFREVQTATG
jgi:hypothetical protein